MQVDFDKRKPEAQMTKMDIFRRAKAEVDEIRSILNRRGKQELNTAIDQQGIIDINGDAEKRCLLIFFDITFRPKAEAEDLNCHAMGHYLAGVFNGHFQQIVDDGLKEAGEAVELSRQDARAEAEAALKELE